MNKKLLVFGIISMFLLTGLATLSVAGTKVKTTDDSTATIEGLVKNKNGKNFPANIEIRIGDDPETAEYVESIPTGDDGSYSIELEADEGTTYQVKAYTVSILFEGDNSQWEEITVYSGQTYELPDLILPNTPKSKSKQLIHPLIQILLQRLSIFRNILRL